MGLSRRRFFELVGSAVVPTILGTAWALDYPTRPVRIIVGFPPGGPTDIFARLIAEWLSNRLGQAFIVENRPGAGSTIGVAAVVGAPPDGYTLLLISTSAVISASYYRNLSFDLVGDIAPVCGVALEPLVMVVNPSVSARTIPEFIAYAKANPGKIIMASGRQWHHAANDWRVVQDDGGRRLAPRSVPGRRTRLDRSVGRPGASHVRSHAVLGWLHTVWKTARFRSFNCDPLARFSGDSRYQRIRPRL